MGEVAGAIGVLLVVWFVGLSNSNPDDWTGILGPLLIPAGVVFGGALALQDSVLDSSTFGLVPFALGASVLIAAVFFVVLALIENRQGGRLNPSGKWVYEGTKTVVRDATEREVFEHQGGDWRHKVHVEWRVTKGLGFVIAAAAPVVAAYVSRDRLSVPEGDNATRYYVAGALVAGLTYFLTVGVFGRFSGPPERYRWSRGPGTEIESLSSRKLAYYGFASLLLLVAALATLFLNIEFWLSAGVRADLEYTRGVAAATLLSSAVVMGLLVLLVHWYDREDKRQGEKTVTGDVAAGLEAMRRRHPAEVATLEEALERGDHEQAEQIIRYLNFLDE